MMKTPAIPNERKSRKTTAAKAVPAKLETLSKRSAAKVFAPKTETTIKPVGLLLERFPNQDKKRTCLELFAPDANVVFVAGSFNGWHPSAMPLQKQAGDRWVVELMLDPGRYENRFIVDGRWTDDPLSSAYVSNPFEGLNCVLEVGLLS
jgi:1,4-alpha-glucan branching enzyme